MAENGNILRNAPRFPLSNSLTTTRLSFLWEPAANSGIGFKLSF
ncbi:hypothetical protein Ec53638_4446 [Escherichia coli 53638]|nr:hypothetical protein Ec53638_4446 [Escherichia coli 53638]EDX33736.1 hypothetical protein Sd1012_0625 [Shigella dysenteriae 1012]EIQ32596.1 hypothetical protein SB96558_1320 [Shigella boydii 965-58]